jgi:hypothetical protein
MDDFDFYDESSNDSGSGTGSGFGFAVLDSITKLGTAEILSQSQPSMTVPYPGPAGSYNAGGVYGAPPRANGAGMFWLLLLGVVGYFAYTRA